MSGETLEAIGIREILAALPHRYPFLLVDRIIEIRGDEHGIGIKNVTANEPQFLGHFPNNPVMPGVLVLEGMAQTAGTLCIRSMPMGQEKPALVYFLTIDKAKFRKPVVPGDVLEYHMNRIKRRKNMWWFRGEAKVGSDVVAEAELGAMIASRAEIAADRSFVTRGRRRELGRRRRGRSVLHDRAEGRIARRRAAVVARQSHRRDDDRRAAPWSIRSLRSARAPQSTGYRGGATRLTIGRELPDPRRRDDQHRHRGPRRRHHCRRSLLPDGQFACRS